MPRRSKTPPPLPEPCPALRSLAGAMGIDAWGRPVVPAHDYSCELPGVCTACVPGRCKHCHSTEPKEPTA